MSIFVHPAPAVQSDADAPMLLDPWGWPHDAADRPGDDLLLCAEAEVTALRLALAEVTAGRDGLARRVLELEEDAANRDDLPPRMSREEWAGRSLPRAAKGIDAGTKAELDAYYDSIAGRSFEDDFAERYGEF